MSNITFGQLPNQANITATTIIPTVSANINYTVTVANLQNYITSTAGNITAGNISAAGNITGAYLLGNGSQLTGITVNYSNANVSALLPVYGGTILANLINFTNNSGIIEQGADRLTITGNATQVNTGAYFNDQGEASIFAYSDVNIVSNVQGNVNPQWQFSHDGNLLAPGNISATGNVTGNYFLGNGSQLTGIIATTTYSNANVIALLSAYGNNISSTGNIVAANLTASFTISSQGNVTGQNILSTGYISAVGNITGGNISVAGNITGNYILGNGSQLTGVISNYSNANVANYLPVFSGNISAGNISASGNVTGGNLVTTGNVAGTYFLGNGSQLTGLPATYGNANVSAFLPTYSGNIANLTVTGNTSLIGTTVLNTYIETTAASANTGSSFTPVWSTGPVQQLTANANFALNAPTGMVSGSSITLVIKQDATGNRVMTPNASYKFGYGVKTLSTTANAIDVMSIFYSGTNYLCNLVKGYV
jgi:hypothetical protein